MNHSVMKNVFLASVMYTVIFGTNGTATYVAPLGNGGYTAIDLNRGGGQTTVIPKGNGTVVIPEHGDVEYYKVIEDDRPNHRYLDDDSHNGNEGLE